MVIASASDFVVNVVLSTVSDTLVFIYSINELVIRHLTPEHPKFVYANIAVGLWITKFFNAIISTTSTNGTLTTAFSDTLHTLSVNSKDFFGNITGKSGVSYIAKHTYLELLGNKSLAQDIAVKFTRAVNSTVVFVMRTFEFL